MCEMERMPLGILVQTTLGASLVTGFHYDNNLCAGL